MKSVIEVKNIGKKYNITHMKGGYLALRDVIANVLKSPFAFLKDKTKKAVGLSKKEEFWALKGVSFEVHKGEVVGIIGSNGAGKSTLLKVLSQITPPTEGEIILRGRVGSLLEVGTGFHPELTGRENIFLNGAILGMKKSEIAAKFDEIVAFADIEKFLDTPVKFYSSGMYVRLAFSVAAHTDPEILLVDEVLAVGDAEFQRKCLGKMNEITKKEGRTILFVSHNMGAIAELCDRVVLLKNSSIAAIGKTSEVIDMYMNSFINKQRVVIEPPVKGMCAINKMWVTNENGQEKNSFDLTETIAIHVEYTVKESLPQLQTAVTIAKNGIGIVQTFDTDDDEFLQTIEPGTYEGTCTIPGSFLKAGKYSIRTTLGVPEMLIHDSDHALGFEIKEASVNTQHKSYKMERDGLVVSPAHWKTIRLH